MINLHKSGTTNTISVYPESGSIYFDNPSGSFVLELTQDYDQSTTEIPASLLNTPTEYNPRLTLQLDSIFVPDYTGLYTVKVKELLAIRTTWSQTNIKWELANWLWSSAQGSGISRVIDTDRAFISGSDTPVFKQYASPDENGAYTTYNS